MLLDLTIKRDERTQGKISKSKLEKMYWFQRLSFKNVHKGPIRQPLKCVTVGTSNLLQLPSFFFNDQNWTTTFKISEYWVSTRFFLLQKSLKNGQGRLCSLQTLHWLQKCYKIHKLSDMWHLTCDTWFVTPDTLHIGYGKHYLKISGPQLTSRTP